MLATVKGPPPPWMRRKVVMSRTVYQHVYIRKLIW
jgi:hypothetical protein